MLVHMFILACLPLLHHGRANARATILVQNKCIGCPLGPGPAREGRRGPSRIPPVFSPYPPHICRKNLRPVMLSSPFTCCDRVQRRGCVRRRREDGAAAGRRRGCVGWRGKGRRGCDEEAARGRTARLRGGGAARLLGSRARRRGGPPLHPGLRRP